MLAVELSHALIDEALRYDLVQIANRIRDRFDFGLEFRVSEYTYEGCPTFVLEVYPGPMGTYTMLGEVCVRVLPETLTFLVHTFSDNKGTSFTLPELKTKNLDSSVINTAMEAAVLLVLTYYGRAE